MHFFRILQYNIGHLAIDVTIVTLKCDNSVNLFMVLMKITYFFTFYSPARVFLEMKKHEEALIQLKLLTQFANNRFEVHESLVHAYIGRQRWREAQLQAIEACRILGKSPRIYVVNNEKKIKK